MHFNFNLVPVPIRGDRAEPCFTMPAKGGTGFLMRLLVFASSWPFFINIT